MTLPHDVPATAGRSWIDLAPEMSAAILRTVEAGWALASKWPDVNAGAAEVPMTERLRDSMRSALKGGALPWGRRMAVWPGTESRSRPDLLRPDGQIDIPTLWIGLIDRFGGHEPHAIIECKRIAGDDRRLCREYVVNGIDRFQTGKYGGNHAAGFMAGYLIAGDASAAARGVNRRLNAGHRSHAPRRDENLEPSILVPEPWAWTSRHPRKAAPAVALHHAFLPVS